MIELYSISSPNVMKVVIALEELGLDYGLRPIDIWAGDQFTDSFKAVNPNSKVPVIVDPEGPGGQPITVIESGAILIYLAEKLGRFLPADARGRCEVMQWLMLQMGSIGPMVGQATHFRRSAPEGTGYSLDRYVSEVHRLCDVLEVRLGAQPEGARWLGGGAYSIADMATYPWIALYYEANGVRMDDLPALKGWMETISARPAVARVRAAWSGMSASDMAKRGLADDDGFDRLFGRGRYSRVPV